MLWALTILLLAMWALGLMSGALLGTWIHLLLGFALIALTLALMQLAGRSRRSAHTRY